MEQQSSRKQKYFRFEDIILYEDEYLIVINKPAGMASLDDKSKQNLLHLARIYDADTSLCHRLDKMTSGVVVISRNAEVYRNISLQFQHRKVRKFYKALIHGVREFEDFVIDYPIRVSSNKRVTIDKHEGKKAATIINTEELFRDFSLLKCEPVTGRMHQIRIHLGIASCPIVGDQLYGGEDLYLSDLKRNYKFSGRKEERPLNHGYLLHAQALWFNHPESGEELKVEAPYPKDLEVTLKMLRKFNQP